MIWYFIGVYIINRTLHGRLEIQSFSSHVEKYFTHSLHSLMKYFSTLEEKFCISALSCNILYILPTDIVQLREFMLIMKNKAINNKEITENFGMLSNVHYKLWYF